MKALGFIGLIRFVFPLNRYETPECDGAARSRVSDTDDPFQGRDLTGSPQFLHVATQTSLYRLFAIIPILVPSWRLGRSHKD